MEARIIQAYNLTFVLDKFKSIIYKLDLKPCLIKSREPRSEI